jgi:hypothetical protein
MTSIRERQAIEEWLEEGPHHAPDSLLEELPAALRRTAQERRNGMSRMALVAAAAAVFVVGGAAALLMTQSGSRVGQGVTPTASPVPCGPVDVENYVLAPADGSADSLYLALEPPYRAVMAVRLSGAQAQIAGVRIRPTDAWEEDAITVEVSGGESFTHNVPGDFFDTDGAQVDLHYVGDYVVTLIGETSECVTRVSITTVEDTVLREYDVRNGRTEPPPPGRPRAPAPAES